MSGIREIALQIMAVAAVIVALGTAPAAAIEISAGADEAASTEVAVAASEIRDAIPLRAFASAPIPQRRPKAARALPAPASRPVAVAHRYGDCSGGWCGRQFVLMIGVAY
jgi:hypothetical protein